MILNIVAKDIAGTASQVTFLLNRMGFEVERQSDTKTENLYERQYTFAVTNHLENVYTTELIEKIALFPQVIRVTIEREGAQTDTNTYQIPKYNSLETLAASLVKDYPNVVSGVLQLEVDPTLVDFNIYEIGVHVGLELVSKGILKSFKTNSLTPALKKLVLPAIAPFSLAKVTKEKLHVNVNPFVLQKKSDMPCCYFLTGFIEGLLRSLSSFSQVKIVETECKAIGSTSCTFQIQDKV